MAMRWRLGANKTRSASIVACLILLSATELTAVRRPSTPLPPQNDRVSRPSFLHRPIPSTEAHLPEWLERHQNLPETQQEMLLRHNAEFQRMSPQAQQQIIHQLHRIDQMAPARRQRYLERNEAIERLTPPERAAFDASMHAVNALSPARRAAVSEAFRRLRRYPVKQRAAMLASAPYIGSLSDAERAMLKNLLSVEPYQPPATDHP